MIKRGKLRLIAVEVVTFYFAAVITQTIQRKWHTWRSALKSKRYGARHAQNGKE